MTDTQMTDADALQAVQDFLMGGGFAPASAIARVLTLATASVANAHKLHEVSVELAAVKADALELKRLVQALQER